MWDGTWYRDIATGGYAQTGLAGLRFFPLLPLLGRVLGLGFASAVAPAMVVVANVSSLALLVFVRRLVIFEGKGRAAAMRSVWLMALFPSAFVLVWGYAEALMLAAVVGGFWAARRHAWALAALAGCRGRRQPTARRALRAARGDRAGAGVDAIAARRPGRGCGRGRGADRHRRRVPAVGALGVRRRPPAVPGAGRPRGTTINPFSRVGTASARSSGPSAWATACTSPLPLLFVVLLVLTFRYWPVSYGVFAAAVLGAALSARRT